MPFRTDMIGLAEDVANEAIHGLFDLIGDEIAARRSHPAWWAVFHREMVKSLPKRALLRRAWHKMRYRRMRAMCTAQACTHCHLD